jgi:hypothetical protein
MAACSLQTATRYATRSLLHNCPELALETILLGIVKRTHARLRRLLLVSVTLKRLGQLAQQGYEGINEITTDIQGIAIRGCTCRVNVRVLVRVSTLIVRLRATRYESYVQRTTPPCAYDLRCSSHTITYS